MDHFGEKAFNLLKYVGKNGIIKKYVKTCAYGKICKIKYS
jgi:hypothetical protein